MSQDKSAENDPERTLVTLEQLSQTIEVMTSVVNRLRQHLSEQLHANSEPQDSSEKPAVLPTETEQPSAQTSEADAPKKESFVVEINQQDSIPVRKSNKTLH